MCLYNTVVDVLICIPLVYYSYGIQSSTPLMAIKYGEYNTQQGKQGQTSWG